MDKVLKNNDAFIQDQKNFYIQNLEQSSQVKWCDDNWQGQNGGWLSIAGSGNTSINFSRSLRLKGFKSIEIAENYVNFQKAMLVAIYRKKSCGQAALKAYLLAMKRLYIVMYEVSTQSHPAYLTTDMLNEVDSRQVEHTKNYADAATSMVYIQRIINEYGLTFIPLSFKHNHQVTNKASHTKKRAKAEKNKAAPIVDNSERDDEDALISIETMVNLAWLSNNHQDEWQQLGLRLVDLLLVTGFRITECLLLERDCWIEKEIIDEETGGTLISQGKPVKVYGIKYRGLKGSTTRIHWLEPNAVPVAQRVIQDIKDITAPYHQHAVWMRETGSKTILPEEIQGDEVSIDQIINHIYGSDSDSGRGLRGVKGNVHKWTINKGIRVSSEKLDDYGQKRKLYDRNDLEIAVRSYLYRRSENVIDFSIEVPKTNETIQIKLDEMLFVTPNFPLSLKRSSRIKPAIQIMMDTDIRKFLGASENNSIFDTFQMTEADGSRIKMATHAPRHNINTFLALAGLSDHQQAMAMGRVDIQQNEAYQHISLEEKQSIQATAVDLVQKEINSYPINLINQSSSNVTNSPNIFYPRPSLNPLEAIKNDGVIEVNSELSLERNLQNSFGGLDSKNVTENFMVDMLNEDLLLGELQDAYNQIDKSTDRGLLTAKEMIEAHAYLHPVPNGGCGRDIAKSGCPHRLTCVSGGGCKHLYVTGRKNELENLLYNYQNMQLALTKHLNTYGEDPAYAESIDRLKADIQNIEIVIEKAKLAKQKRIPIQVFSNGKNFSNGSKRITIVDLFADEVKAMKSKMLTKEFE